MQFVNVPDGLVDGSQKISQIGQFRAGHVIYTACTSLIALYRLIDFLDMFINHIEEFRGNIQRVGTILGTLDSGSLSSDRKPHTMECGSVGPIPDSGSSTSVLCFTGEVDGIQQLLKRNLQFIRDMGILCRMGKHIYESLGALLNPRPVLFDGIRIIPAVTPALQHCLAAITLLLFHNLSGLLQHPL